MTTDERNSWNQQIIDEFRANAGSVAQFGGKGLVLLHHTGAKSGTQYVSPLAGFPHGEDGWVIVASNAGRDNHPSWYHNLQAKPETVIEAPGEEDVRTLKVAARRRRGRAGPPVRDRGRRGPAVRGVPEGDDAADPDRGAGRSWCWNRWHRSGPGAA